jgi:NAD(P)-dependent dehydrogenase (short-subunit alcohol dehydrogenase family)
LTISTIYLFIDQDKDLTSQWDRTYRLRPELHAKEHAMSLNGKVAIVTGSGQGLGLAYARELARQGAAVVINDVNAETAAQAVAQIEADGGRAAAVVVPVGTTDAAKALVAGAVENFGRLDILVTNAGILRDKSLLKMTDEDFDLVINVHLKGTFTCVREAFAYFKENSLRGPDHHHRFAHGPARQLRPDQLRCGEGRHRGHGADLGAGDEEGRSDR